MSSEADWKDKFINLSTDYEVLEKNSTETQKVFCRTIIRLTMSVKGLDQSLDPYLTRIHDAVKKDCGAKITKKLDDLSDTMIKEADGKKAQDPFEKLLNHFDLDSGKKKNALAVWKRLVKNPVATTDRDIDGLVVLLGAKPLSANVKASAAKKGGLFSKLFSSEEETETSSDEIQASATFDPNAILKDVLADLKWPEAVSAQINKLIGQLHENTSTDTWIEVITRINKIILDALSSFQSEVKSAEQFLTDLSSRLQEIDGYVQSASAIREASLQSGRELGQTMDEQVDGISSSMKSAVDLAQLKDTVANRLDVIHQNVSRHLETEEHRHREAQAREADLQDKLANLENETGQLKQQMLEASAKAVKDAVTGLPNRQAYDDRVEQEFNRWKRFGEPLALLVWDIDDFKKINDRYGHRSGDKALKVMGGKLQSTIRETDFIGRYGGEEFVVLLVGTDLEGAKEVAEKMRLKIEKIALKANDEMIRMTISGGLSMFQHGDMPADVFERADQALYKAKRSGKNQWIVA
ncbi:MAG: GGDEF domain-containing protein [Gammaproteobacteria bacterium]